MTSSSVFDVRGKNAIVTGAAMGIGFAVAQRLLEAGANVVIADLDAQAALDAARRLADLPGRAASLAADVSRDDAGARMVEACCQSFGSVDVLVNNAGIYPYIPFCEIEPADYDRIFRVNLRGLTFASQAAARRMREQGRGGAIVNVTSVAGLTPRISGATLYGASKAAVLAVTRSMALELGPHAIRVNSVAPGAVSTEGTARVSQTLTEEQLRAMARMSSDIPLGRVAMPDDIAKVVLFLASPAADYITGSMILVDGGMLLT